MSVKNKSPHTRKGYTTDIKMFFVETDRTEIDLGDLDMNLMLWLTASCSIKSAKSVQRRLTSARGFCRFLGIENPLDDYTAPTPLPGDPHPIPEGMEGVRRMIACARRAEHAALVSLCGQLGCRMSEALSVGPTHFDFHDKTLVINGKGAKYRQIPVVQSAMQVLLPVIVAAASEGRPALIPYSDRSARKIITELGESAKLSRRIASHDLRATVATAMYDKDKDIVAVQKFLGHSDVKQTLVYVRVDLGKMRAAADV